MAKSTAPNWGLNCPAEMPDAGAGVVAGDVLVGECAPSGIETADVGITLSGILALVGTTSPGEMIELRLSSSSFILGSCKYLVSSKL